MKTIILHGKLAQLVGERHYYEISTVKESISALCANFPEFKNEIDSAHLKGIGYKIRVNDDGIKNDNELFFPIGSNSEIHIMPSLIGSDDPGFKIVLGATLIAASFASGGALAPLGYLGAGLVVGGLVGVFMGGSGVFTPPDSRDPDKRDDFFFSGPINRTEQGYPVPVGYGRMFVGSTTISSGISSSYFTAPELLGGRDGPIRRPPGSNLSANGRTPP